MAKKTIEKVIALRLYNEVATDKKILKILSQLPGNVSGQQFIKNAILEYYGNHLNKSSGEFSAALSESSAKNLLDEKVASKEAVAEIQKSLLALVEKESAVERGLSELKIAILSQASRMAPQPATSFIPQAVPAQMMSPEMYAMTTGGQYPPVQTIQQPAGSTQATQLSQKSVNDEVQPLTNPSPDVLGFLKDMGV